MAVTMTEPPAGDTPRVAVYWNDATLPATDRADTAMRAAVLTVAPGATVTEADPTKLDENADEPARSAADHVNVEVPHPAASVLRTESVTVADEPRGTIASVGDAATVGVPCTQPGPGVGDGVGEGLGVPVGPGVGVGVGIAVGVGVGTGPPVTAAATALAASTIPEPQPGGQPLGANGCAVCCM